MNAADYRRKIGLRSDALNKQHKLISAIAHDVVPVAHAVAQPSGGNIQNTIADQVAVRVVYLLEVVEIDEQDRERPVTRMASIHPRGQSRQQEGPIRQAGKRVAVLW